jgi:GntR family transcriptional regulator
MKTKLIKIDPRSSKPIFQQIVENIKENILKGILLPGDKMPSVRDLSVAIQINPNTVARAYKELEQQKIIEILQGRGTFVAQTILPQTSEDKIQFVKSNLKKIIIETKFMGVNKSDFMRIVDEIYNEMGGIGDD